MLSSHLHYQPQSTVSGINKPGRWREPESPWEETADCKVEYECNVLSLMSVFIRPFGAGTFAIPVFTAIPKLCAQHTNLNRTSLWASPCNELPSPKPYPYPPPDSHSPDGAVVGVLSHVRSGHMIMDGEKKWEVCLLLRATPQSSVKMCSHLVCVCFKK